MKNCAEAQSPPTYWVQFIKGFMLIGDVKVGLSIIECLGNQVPAISSPEVLWTYSSWQRYNLSRDLVNDSSYFLTFTANQAGKESKLKKKNPCSVFINPLFCQCLSNCICDWNFNFILNTSEALQKSVSKTKIWTRVEILSSISVFFYQQTDTLRLTLSQNSQCGMLGIHHFTCFFQTFKEEISFSLYLLILENMWWPCQGDILCECNP